MVVIGIDPGQSGGIVLLSDSWILPHKMPETEHDIAELFDGTERPRFAFIEKVGPARGRDGRQQGVSSAFTFGRGYGFLRGVITALAIPFEDVTPQKWQKAMNCLTGGDKNVSKSAAQRLWPDVKFTHATADAALIAEYGRRHLAATGRL